MKLQVPDIYVLNRCTKYLARDMNLPSRHSYFEHLQSQPSASKFLEGWRFPVVDTHRENDEERSDRWNAVTFVWMADDLATSPSEVAVVSSFAPTHAPLQMQRVGQSRYWAATVRLPVGQVYDYVFRVDGAHHMDPINPRRRASPDKAVWSFFWTDYCYEPVTFEEWERHILKRLTNHILPLNTKEVQIFLSRLDPASLAASHDKLFRFDQAVGVVNFIDKLIAGPELQHRDDYKSCLKAIDKLLRARDPVREPSQMTEETYTTLYDQMGQGNVPGWDTSTYDNPAHFLRLLRRHSFTGAFSHPRYGGNAGGYAWAYLAEAFPPFNWRQGLEAPLGLNTEYLG